MDDSSTLPAGVAAVSDPGPAPAGVAAPPIVLVHGFGGSFDTTWRRTGFVDALATAGRDVLPFDLPGHGTAPKPYEPAAYDDLPGSIGAALPDGEPIDAIGYSMGAACLLRLVIREPHRFRRVVLAAVGDDIFRPMVDTERLAVALESGVPGDDDQIRFFVRLASTRGNDPLALAACTRRRTTPLTEDEVRRAKVPSLLVVGDRDFAAPADRLAAALPTATYVTLPGVDHFGTLKDDGFRDAAIAFLAGRT